MRIIVKNGELGWMAKQIPTLRHDGGLARKGKKWGNWDGQLYENLRHLVSRHCQL